MSDMILNVYIEFAGIVILRQNWISINKIMYLQMFMPEIKTCYLK